MLLAAGIEVLASGDRGCSNDPGGGGTPVQLAAAGTLEATRRIPAAGLSGGLHDEHSGCVVRQRQPLDDGVATAHALHCPVGACRLWREGGPVRCIDQFDTAS